MTFTVGETVVYPNHGAAVIEDIEMRTIKGEDRQYLVLRIVAQQDLVVRHDLGGVALRVQQHSVVVAHALPAECLREQGVYYRDAFRIFRDHTEDLFSVTVWGLTDDRSWRVDSGAPLLFDENLQAKREQRPPKKHGLIPL